MDWKKRHRTSGNPVVKCTPWIEIQIKGSSKLDRRREYLSSTRTNPKPQVWISEERRIDIIRDVKFLKENISLKDDFEDFSGDKVEREKNRHRRNYNILKNDTHGDSTRWRPVRNAKCAERCQRRKAGEKREQRKSTEKRPRKTANHKDWSQRQARKAISQGQTHWKFRIRLPSRNPN